MMKKFVAGKGAAGLILAGLMVNSGAMAAAGQGGMGGSGTVKISVQLVTSTCAIAIPGEVTFDPINKNDVPGAAFQFIASKNFDITLSHCSGKTVKMTVKSTTSLLAGAPYLANMTHVNYTYDIQIPNPGPTITGGKNIITQWFMTLLVISHSLLFLIATTIHSPPKLTCLLEFGIRLLSCLIPLVEVLPITSPTCNPQS
ncbi:TPA: fimbrial protein [Salmonella enterica subsp. enterica serovar Napoli]|nr:fimbrial protein [Salmonella enterica subsp. enterica serovar Napoli]